MTKPAPKKPATIQDALRDAIKRLPADQQQRARKVLRDRGVLKDAEHKEPAE